MADYVLFEMKFSDGTSMQGTYIKGLDEVELKKRSRHLPSGSSPSLPSESFPRFGSLIEFICDVYNNRDYNPQEDSVTTIPAEKIFRNPQIKGVISHKPVDSVVLNTFEELLFKNLGSDDYKRLIAPRSSPASC